MTQDKPESPTEAKAGQTLAGATGSATSEAVRGICAARLQTAEHRAKLVSMGMWCRYDEHWNKYSEEIAALDGRLDALLQRESPNAQAQPQAPTINDERKTR